MTARLRRRRDGGQTTVLIIGYAVLALLLITVVANLSRVFLAHRSLEAAADSAAVAAVQALRDKPYYGGGVGDRLPLDRAGAREAVADHLAAAQATRTCDGFALDSVTISHSAVTVRVSCLVDVPFANVVSGSYASGVPITGTATAQMTTRP